MRIKTTFYVNSVGEKKNRITMAELLILLLYLAATSEHSRVFRYLLTLDLLFCKEISRTRKVRVLCIVPEIISGLVVC